MVVIGHYIGNDWKLCKRVLNFVDALPPRSRIAVVDALFKCFLESGIENKVCTMVVDNARYNDVCVNSIKGSLIFHRTLDLNGELFHVRCGAYVLNIIVQYGLSGIKEIIENV